MPTFIDPKLSIVLPTELPATVVVDPSGPVANVTVEFGVQVFYNEPGGPWDGTVHIAGIDDPLVTELFLLAQFHVPRYELPDEPLPPKHRLSSFAIMAVVPVQELNEDPDVDRRFVEDQSAWIPGLGPWIHIEGSSQPATIPRPEGGPVGGLGPLRGYRRTLGYVVETAHDDELLATLRLSDGAGNGASAATEQVTLTV